MKALPQEKFVRVVVVLWAIWHARRKIIHEDFFQNPLSTHGFINRFVSDLEQARPATQKLGGERRAAEGGIGRWIPPGRGTTKLNIDAALSNEGAAALSAVARDGRGAFLGASVVVMAGLTEPELAEAMACREALALASDLQLRRITVASDCANAIRNIQGLERDYMARLSKKSRLHGASSLRYSLFMKVVDAMKMPID